MGNEIRTALDALRWPELERDARNAETWATAAVAVAWLFLALFAACGFVAWMM